MTKEVEKIILDIILTEMTLPTDYGEDNKGNEIPVGLIGFSNYSLGDTDKIQIFVTSQNKKPISSNTYTSYDDEFIETNSVQTVEDISIDIMSQNSDARSRNWEIFAALNSIYSKQQQEKYFFKIFKILSQMNNVSGAEGGSNVNRFNVVFKVFAWYNKEKVKDEFYQEFSARVDDEDTIDQDDGLIEITEGP